MQKFSNRLRIEQERLKINAQAISAQLSVWETRVARLRALAFLRRREVASRRIVAGTSGGMPEVTAVQVGQQVQPGASLARVGDPRSHKRSGGVASFIRHAQRI